MSEHTPGKWEAHIGGGGCSITVNNTMLAPIVVPINPNWLLTHPHLVKEAQSNARLIAAAPETKRQRDELLAACKHALPYLANHVAMTLDQGPGDRLAHDAVEAAIALCEKEGA